MGTSADIYHNSTKYSQAGKRPIEFISQIQNQQLQVPGPSDDNQ